MHACMWTFYSSRRFPHASISDALYVEIKVLLTDPVRAAWAAGEADTKPAREIPVEAKRSREGDDPA
eukprot:m.141690 g.141690  ORF g.141690 m.141690 type:complete len:67 (+) comp14966_c0_seq44:816-1016(+)